MAHVLKTDSERSKTKNYHLVSLLSVVIKVSEKRLIYRIDGNLEK